MNPALESVERALRASELRYRRLFESAKDGILIIDADSGKIIDVNPYLCELLGYASTDFIGKQVWDFVSFKDVLASKAAFRELLAVEYVAYEDKPLQRSDGQHVDVGFVSNVYLVEGERTIQCNIRDITARKRAAVSHAHLEDRLRVSQKMEAIGSLAGGIAHDFNNLLSVILCYLEFALEHLKDGDPLKDDLMQVDRSARLAASLTRQLLAFSRKQVLKPTPLNLNRAVQGLEPMLRRIIGENIDLNLTLSTDIGVTMADQSQIEQVIMNLVINARDAMPDGGKLTIESENVEVGADLVIQDIALVPGSYVRLAITDSGIGMDAATQARAFEPFFTTKEPGTGTGLGLSTVYGIVRQSGGNIWIYSEPGHGTTFKVYLPRETKGLPLNATDTDAIQRRASLPAVGTETILVVEDDEAVRELAKRILSVAGYRVLTATNGAEGLRVCESHVGDIPLVLSDVVMPQLGGRMFAAELAKIRPATKVIFMSGYSDDAILRHGVLQPGTQFIGKPLNAADLVLKVRRTLDAPVPPS